MQIQKSKTENNSKILEFGNILFSIGIFFIATAPFLSAIVFFPSLIIGTFIREDKILNDKWNYPFIAVSILMLISCFVQRMQNYYPFDYEKNLSFIGLFNWLPLFWIYWGFQPYLLTKNSRKKTLFLIILGSIPVLISGLTQYFFDWYGPFDFFYGFIVWFQRPITTSSEGLTALFNNQNYAGTWLSMIFYIGLAFTLVKEDLKIKKFISLFVTIFIFLATCLTYSRNAILSIFAFILFFIKSKKFKKFLQFLIISLILSVILGELINSQNLILKVIKYILESSENRVPEVILQKIGKMLTIEDIKSSPRIILWNSAINLISKKSIFGWGAGSFPLLFNDYDLGNIGGQHTHNLPLEIALSYGIPSAIILTLTILLLAINNFKKDFKINYSERFSDINIFDTAWKTAIGIFLFSQLFDITYYDSRISVFSWVLFSGLRNIIKEN